MVEYKKLFLEILFNVQFIFNVFRFFLGLLLLQLSQNGIWLVLIWVVDIYKRHLVEHGFHAICIRMELNFSNVLS